MSLELIFAGKGFSPSFLPQSLNYTGKTYILFESEKLVFPFVKDATKS